MTENPPHIVIVPSPGVGHLIPIVEFAKTLTHRYHFSITLFIPSFDPLSAATKSLLSSLHHVFLSPVLPDVPNPNDRIETLISLTVARSLPALRREIDKLSVKITAIIADLFSTDVFDVASEIGAPAYVFFPSTAMLLSLCFYLPKLDAAVKGPFRELPEKVKIPGCFPISGSELLDPLQDREDEAYRVMLYHSKRFRNAKGIILNSFVDMEPDALKALQGGHEDYGGKIPRLYPIGPLLRSSDPDKLSGTDCLQWLDNQPAGSVLYVSFGSGGTLSHSQIIELAAGLEASDHRFLWVIRPPNDGSSNGSFFSHSLSDPIQFLPPGFLSRVGTRGLVVPSWAPQTEILSHRSTAGFLSHCGWNSTLEAIFNGVPMMAWPLYAEQRMNAVFLTEEVGVAVRAGEGREEIAAAVAELMEGEEGKKVRNRMREMKAKARGGEERARGALGEFVRDLLLTRGKETRAAELLSVV